MRRRWRGTACLPGNAFCVVGGRDDEDVGDVGGGADEDADEDADGACDDGSIQESKYSFRRPSRRLEMLLQ